MNKIYSNNLKFFVLFIGLVVSSCSVNSKHETENKNDAQIRREKELAQKPLKIYIDGDKFGFGAIIYVNNYGQSSNELILDANNIGITSYPFSSLIQSGNGENKYQYFRVVDSDTIPLELGGTNDSTCISSATPTSRSSNEIKKTYKYIQFYAGKYPERTIGIHFDSTEIGRWDNIINKELIKLSKMGVEPQK